jgi:hypothetical protein
MADPYAAYEIARVRDFNPDTGASLVLTFAGTEAKMEEIADYYEVAGLANPIGYGYKTTTHKTAAGVVLIVRIPDDILYTERWQLASEVIQIPIWRDETVRNYIPALAGLDLNEATGRNLRSFMWRVGLIQRGALNLSAGVMASTVFDNTTPPSGADDLGSFSVKELEVMFQIVREGQYMDWKRPVLKRQRFIPSVNVATRTRLVGRAQLYSLNGIANVFGIPDDNYDQAATVYDNLPTAAKNTYWSWKLGRDDSEGVTGSAKVIECKEWSFGMWSTITNTFIE